MKSAVDILRINYKSKERRKYSKASHSPMSKIGRKGKSKSKSKSRKYIINREVKPIRRLTEDANKPDKQTKKDLNTLERMLRERKKRQEKRRRKPLGVNLDYTNSRLNIPKKSFKRNRTKSPYRGSKGKKSFGNFTKRLEKEYVRLRANFRNFRASTSSRSRRGSICRVA